MNGIKLFADYVSTLEEVKLSSEGKKVVHLIDVYLNMEESLFQCQPEIDLIEAMNKFMAIAEELDVYGVHNDRVKFERLERMGHLSYEWNKTHGFPHHCTWSYIPEWYVENREERLVFLPETFATTAYEIAKEETQKFSHKVDKKFRQLARRRRAEKTSYMDNVCQRGEK